MRIGDPVPGEFAAWRWGSRFGRRKRRLKSLVQGGPLLKLEKGTAWAAGIALAPLAPVLAPLAVVGGVITIPLILLARMESNWYLAKGSPAGVGKMQLKSGGITPSDVFPGWSIHIQAWAEVPSQGGTRTPDPMEGVLRR